MKLAKNKNQHTHRAMNQILNKQICASISKDLRKKYSRRSIRIMTDDTVKVMRGEYKGLTGKVTKISTLSSGVAIEGNKNNTNINSNFFIIQSLAFYTLFPFPHLQVQNMVKG